MTGAPHSFLNRMLLDTGGAAEVYHVTNLNASGAGSFVDAITTGSTSVTRVVVFDVSGVCNLTPFSTISLYGRGNLFVAGETAPDPGDGNGRGFHLRGAEITVKEKNCVFRHITVQPSAGDWIGRDRRDAGQGDKEGINWYGGGNNGGPIRGFAVVNCSYHGCTDETTQMKQYSGGDSGPATQHVGPTVFADNIMAACLHEGQRKITLDGDDPSTVQVKDGGFGPQTGYGAFNMLFLRNEIIGAVRRGPQIPASSDALMVNNDIFGHGRSNGGDSAVPFILYAVPGDGIDTWSPHGECRIGMLSNHVEAGKYSDPWDVNGQITSSEGQWGADSNAFIYDDRKNKQISYYNRAGMDIHSGIGATMDQYNADGPYTVAQDVWDPTPPLVSSQLAGVLSQPPLAVPAATILSADDARVAVKNHAGAWPANRHKLDKWLFTERDAKTYEFYGIVQEKTFISTRTGAPPNVPSSPWTIQSNGLTEIENWLNQLHVAAGGYPDYAAAEWFDRRSQAPG